MLKLKSVRYIKVFFGFANFHKKFIKNFNKNKIAASLMLILKNVFSNSNSPIDNLTPDVIADIVDVSRAEVVFSNKLCDGNIENLFIAANWAKSKKSKFIESKKLKLSKFKKLNLVKKLNFAKDNFFRTDFFILKAKKTFTHLWKAFTKTSNLYYFQSQSQIFIEIDVLRFLI